MIGMGLFLGNLFFKLDDKIYEGKKISINICYRSIGIVW